MLNEIKKIIYRNSYILRKNKIQTNNYFNTNQNGGTACIEKHCFSIHDYCLYTKKHSFFSIKGGKTLSVSYNNNIYKFEESEIDDNHFILYSYEENPLDCVSIIISKEYKLVEIHGIGNYKNCLQNTNTNIGTTLLKITLKMLKKYKNKLGINMIILTDNSIKICNKKNIILSKMLILLTGDTWYGKYGFRPYDIQVDSMNDRTNKEYNKNKDIMKKITITEINILKYIELTKKEKIINDVKQILLIKPDMLVTNFLSQFLKEYDKTCKYFIIFYEELFKNLDLTDFYKQSFALKL